MNRRALAFLIYALVAAGLVHANFRPSSVHFLESTSADGLTSIATTYDGVGNVTQTLETYASGTRTHAAEKAATRASSTAESVATKVESGTVGEGSKIGCE